MLWQVAAPMAAAQLIRGYQLGTKVVGRGGDVLVRRVVLGVVVLVAKIGFDLIA